MKVVNISSSENDATSLKENRKNNKPTLIFITPLGTKAEFFTEPIKYYKNKYHCIVLVADELINLIEYCSNGDQITQIYKNILGYSYLSSNTFIISYCSSVILGAIFAKQLDKVNCIFINGAYFFDKNVFSQYEIDTFNLALANDDTVAEIFNIVRENNLGKLKSDDVIEYNKVHIYSDINYYFSYLKNIRLLLNFNFVKSIGVVKSSHIFIQASNDTITNSKYPYYFSDQFPNSYIVMMENTGHYDFVQGSVAVFHQIDSFIERTINDKC